jgi:RimJ/RimL family protein N-acetyltransferase
VSKLELTTLLLYILDHNRPSIALGEKLGFEEWGRLRRVATLDGVDRDHLILGWRAPDPPSPEGSRSSGPGTRTDRRGGETA